jgi:flagellar hook-associated protein 2
MMATISSPGIGSGLDVKNIVSQLVALEQKPLETLKTKATGLETRLSAFSQLAGQISSLQLQADKMASTLTWGAMSLTSSNSAAVSGIAGTAASAGTVSVQVDQLASGQASTSSVIAPATDLSGTLSFQLGSWDTAGTTFTQRASTSPVEVVIESTDTLTQVASKINAAQTGVTASIMKDNSGERLVLRSTETGEAAGFRVTASSLGVGSSLEQLRYAPDLVISDKSDRRTSVAQNAKASVNGVALTSTNNQFNDAVPGVNFTVSQVTASPVTLTVKSDSTGMRTTLTDFVKAYNTLATNLSELTRYDAKTKSAGALQGDNTATGLQNALRRLLSGNGPTNASFKRLSDVGLEFQLDGTLKVNDTKLDAALAKATDLKTFFSTYSTDANATLGLGRQLQSFTKGLLDTVAGTLTTKNRELQSALDRNAKEQDRVSDRISRTQARLEAQYSRLDSKLGSLTALSNYVSQQVTAWNNQKSSS